LVLVEMVELLAEQMMDLMAKIPYWETLLLMAAVVAQVELVAEVHLVMDLLVDLVEELLTVQNLEVMEFLVKEIQAEVFTVAVVALVL
jgi:hypothetical protein